MIQILLRDQLVLINWGCEEMAKLKTADIWVVKPSNTNDTNISERLTCFN